MTMNKKPITKDEALILIEHGDQWTLVETQHDLTRNLGFRIGTIKRGEIKGANNHERNERKADQSQATG